PAPAPRRAQPSTFGSRGLTARGGLQPEPHRPLCGSAWFHPARQHRESLAGLGRHYYRSTHTRHRHRHQPRAGQTEPMIQETLSDALTEAARVAAPILGLHPRAVPQAEVTRPRQKEHGDWSTNLALVLAPKAARPPR